LTCCYSHFDLVSADKEVPSSPHHFHLDGVRRGRSSSRRRFLFHRGEEGLPLLFTSSFPFPCDEEGLPLLFVLLFPFRHDEEGLPLLFVLLFLFLRSKEVCPPFHVVIPISMKRRSTTPLRILTPISTRQVGYHPTTLTYVIKYLYINCI